jgi:flagellar capping protein FliD
MREQISKEVILMTAIQNEFQKMLETERANRAREEETRRANIMSERIKSDTLAETKKVNEAEIQHIYSSIGLQQAQVDKINSEMDKIAAEIQNINADTKLTEAQRNQAIAKTWETWIGNVTNMLDPFGLVRSTASGIGSSTGKVIGKTIGGALIG